MNRTRAPQRTAMRLVLLALLAMGVSPLLRAAEPPKGYDAFALVKTRNIFDPNRRAPVKQSEQPRATAPSRPRSVHLSLTGTMVTDGKSLAFFSGSRSEFNKIIGIGGQVGDFTVKSITGGQVDLDQAGHRTSLAVGKRLQLEGTEADPVEPDSSIPPADTASTAPSQPAAPPAAAPSGGSPSEILKRMMERRAQEMKK